MISGFIPGDRKIDAVNLAIIAVAVLVVVFLMRPDVFDRLKILELSGVRLEMLEKVKEKQAKQEGQLEDIALILPLLLPQAERKHLLNIATGETAGYEGNHPLRTELRRLRSIGLIAMRSDQHISSMKDGLTFDLSAFVRLTELGERWVRRIRDIEKAEEFDQMRSE